MPVRYKKSISAMALVSVMVILHCSSAPTVPPVPAHPNLVILASAGGGYVGSSSNVTIYGNGKVVYENRVVCCSPPEEHKEAEVTQERIEGLIKIFNDNNFFSFNDDYSLGGDMIFDITYKDPPVIKTVYGNGFVIPGHTSANPAGWDTIWNECWKIKQELFP